MIDDNTTTQYYRDCFGSDSGKKVLAHLLADMGFYDDNIQTVDEMAVSNYARRILKRLGIIGTENLDYYSNMFINAPVILKGNENE